MGAAMTLDSLVRIIGAIVAPMVMVTSCSIFLSALLNRYESMSSRMRAMHRERLDLLDLLLRSGDAGATMTRERRRVAEIERQLPGLLRRHRLMRDATIAVSSAVVVLVAGMFLIAATGVTRAPAAAVAALAVFLLGTATFLAGVATAAIELWGSQKEVAYEIEDGLAIH
jgi:hypothetical protein